MNCAFSEKICDEIGEGHFGCVEAVEPDPQPDPEPEPDPEPADDCRGITGIGYCEGDTAVWREKGTIKQSRCDDCFQQCGLLSEEVGYYCL